MDFSLDFGALIEIQLSDLQRIIETTFRIRISENPSP